MRRFAFFVLVSLVSGCATELPFPQYQGNAEVKSQHRAEVTLVHGVMLVNLEGPTLAAGGAFVTLPGNWNANDQRYIAYYEKKHRDFIGAFCAELERLGMFKKAEIFAELPTMPTWTDTPTTRSKTSDVPIMIHYVTTTFDSAHMNGYTLDVVLTIGSDKAFVREYHIDSAKGDNFWTKFNTNGAQSRQKADAQLVSALIQDVEVWLKEDAAGG